MEPEQEHELEDEIVKKIKKIKHDESKVEKMRKKSKKKVESLEKDLKCKPIVNARKKMANSVTPKTKYKYAELILQYSMSLLDEYKKIRSELETHRLELEDMKMKNDKLRESILIDASRIRKEIVRKKNNGENKMFLYGETEIGGAGDSPFSSKYFQTI